MKKTLSLIVCLFVSITMASAQDTPSTDFSSFFQTGSSDITLSNIQNDETRPWTITDGVAKSGNPSTTKSNSILSVDVECESPVTLTLTYTAETYSSYDYFYVYEDSRNLISQYNVSSETTTTVYLNKGKHTLKFQYYHGNYNYSSYPQVATMKNVKFTSTESQTYNINLSAPGTLGTEALSLPGVSVLTDIKFLRISGPMNSADYAQLKNMTSLRGLDMTDVQTKAIPASQFEGKALRYFAFPKTITRIHNRAFYDNYLIEDLVIPEGVDSIGEYAFYRNTMQNVKLPSTLKVMQSYAFYNNDVLKNVDFNGASFAVGNYAFQSCDALATLTNTQNIKTLGSGAFDGCPYLTSVGEMVPTTVNGSAFQGCYRLESIDMSMITSLGTYAFHNCDSLKTINLESVTSIPNYTFYYCDGLTEVVLNDNITSVGDYAFYNCPKLRCVTLGASVTSLSSNCFNSCPIAELYCNAPTPPAPYSTSSSYIPFSSSVPTSAKLYVPEYAMVSYKLHPYWSKFTSVDTNPNKVSNLNIASALELTSNARIPDAPNVAIQRGGSLTVNGDNAQEFGDILSWNSIGTNGSIISRCANITSTASQINFYHGKLYWYFLSMPFDVNVADMTTTVSTAAFAVRSYDGENRANSGTGNNWVNVPSDGTLKAGKGYITMTSDAAYIKFPATDDTRNLMFRNTAVTTPLNAYESADASNAGWNLVGNPYPSFYDIYYMDFTAPITIWDVDNRTYKAYSIADDNLALYPCQAFFVQKPEGVDAITFQPEGRQTASTIEHSASARDRVAKSANRKLINLTLSGNGIEDATRLVVNPQASADYELTCDAAKMLSLDNDVPQIYSISDDVMYAINEAPFKGGNAELGIVIPEDGTYTISASRNDMDVEIEDSWTNARQSLATPYTFDAEAGTMEGRFRIIINGGTVDGIANINSVNNNDNAVYDLAGRRVSSRKANLKGGIYVKNGKKTILK